MCFIYNAFCIIGLGVSWKCEKKTCKGRGHSMVLTPPFTFHQLHNHLPDPVRIVVLQTEEQMRKPSPQKMIEQL